MYLGSRSAGMNLQAKPAKAPDIRNKSPDFLILATLEILSLLQHNMSLLQKILKS